MDVTALPRRNKLADETSPYLQQHADNPVDWRPWGPDAFADAQALDKPILLSVGYAACHWCHVMAHESFEDLDTASMMNALFVNIKVDREERPDLDAVYQAALSASGQQGGWPLTMFLTPDGRPFFGGTYFPPDGRYGRPAFRDVLRGVADLYATERDRALAQASTLTQAVAELHAKTTESVDATPHAVERVGRLLTREIDPFLGGTAGAPKFPQCPLYDLLWRLYRRTGAAPYGQAVRVTLEHMAQGGIYDHLGGGFARYATDENWLIPHFEKMLYDNAQLIDLMTQVWRLTRAPLLAQRVAETIGWLDREMTAELGAFAAALDADSEGEEGRFYVWTATDIDRALGKDSPAFKAAYGVIPGGNWEGRTILNRSKAPELKSPSEEAALARGREILLRVRDKRQRPMRDDKILADWNGLTAAALAEAGGAFDRPDWIALARRAFDGVVEGMSRDGKLMHAYRRGRAQPLGGLEDYAAMMKAALALHEVTGDPRPLDLARGWAAYVDLRFSDADGGYRMTSDEVDDLPVRPRAGQDHAAPSGAGLMIANLARLRHLTGVAAYELRARSAVRAFAPAALRRPMGAASVLAGIELLEHPLQVVIAGDPTDPRALALARSALAAPQPNRILLRSPDPTSLPGYHPAHGKGAIDGAPAAYVCRGPVCSAPVLTPAALEAALTDAPPSKSKG